MFRFVIRRSCGLTDEASDFYERGNPKIAGSNPATINSNLNLSFLKTDEWQIRGH